MTTTIQTRPAAVWARVSTTEQKEISPDTQISRCLDLLKSKGYAATKIFSVDYCSLDLDSCKEFQQLRDMIKNREIDALAVYDRDRLKADGLQRLVFLSELKEAKIELVLCNGSPVIDSDEGQIVELALAIGKKRSVLRARSGARDGLHDRVVLKNKPANHRHVYGFDWDIEHERLVPNADYETLKLIFNLALAGSGYMKIINELTKMGIRSPKGSTWCKGQISNIIRNPIYAGKYAALKTAVMRTDKPGFKVRQLPENEWTFIPGVIIVNPPITWEQRIALLQQVQKHILLSKRHANYNYLLRGMIMCQEHFNVKGEYRKYHGRPLRSSYGYVCPGAGSGGHNFIDGKKLEQSVKDAINSVFLNQNSSLWQKISELEKVNRPQLEADLKKQQVALSKIFRNEASIEERHLNNDIIDEVYDLLRTKFNLQQKAIESGIRETQQQLDATNQIQDKVKSWNEIRDQFMKNTGKFTDSQWRYLLESLDCRIHIAKSSQEIPEDFADNKPMPIMDYQEIRGYSTKVEQGKASPRRRHVFKKDVAYACGLNKFNAVMYLKSPSIIQPQTISDIGLSIPWN